MTPRGAFGLGLDLLLAGSLWFGIALRQESDINSEFYARYPRRESEDANNARHLYKTGRHISVLKSKIVCTVQNCILISAV
jgi:hypothetical protein